MIIAPDLDACSCATWEPEVHLCVIHHAYHRQGKRLASVSQVLKTWPIPPGWAAADPVVLANARDRGIAVDSLFSSYVNGTLTKIPAGTRADAVDLFFKAKTWWDTKRYKGRAQVILAGADIAGTCDLLMDNDDVWDIKTVFKVEKTYQIQVGAYCRLFFEEYGRLPNRTGILHLTKRFEKPVIIEYDVLESIEMWETIEKMWRLVTRLTA